MTRGDYRLPVLFTLAVLILVRNIYTFSAQHFCGKNTAGEEETVAFKCTEGALTLFLPGEEVEIQVSSGNTTGLPQFIRPVFFLPVSINKADRELLQTIPGIGPSLSQAIVDFRRSQDGFRSYPELLEIRGIGPATLKRIKEHTTL